MHELINLILYECMSNARLNGGVKLDHLFGTKSGLILRSPT